MLSKLRTDSAEVSPDPASRDQPRPSVVAAVRRELRRALDDPQPRWHGWLWTVLLLGTLLVLALRLGAADWYTSFPGAGINGTTVRLPNTFTDFDHPFHIAKEAATLAALRHGWLPRWYAFHQGGFPAEFYPSGADLVVVAAYLLALGQIPLAVVHKLVVIGVFFLPPLAFWAMTRRDGFPLSLALVASILHLGLPGQWVGGGGTGLFMTGLWPDIFATYLTLFLALWGADYVRYGSRRGLLLASATGALAVYCNPRSLLAIGAVLIALTSVAVLESLRERDDRDGSPSVADAARGRLKPIGALLRAGTEGDRCWWSVVLRTVNLGLLLLLLCAALLVPLHAHQSRYHFTFYTAFARPSDILHYSTMTLPLPVSLLALVGLPLALRRGFYARTMALLLPVSFVIVALAGWYLRNLSVFAQLEGGRLVSMLRLPTIFLAAFAVHELLRLLVRLFRLPSATFVSGMLAVGLSAVAVTSAASPLHATQRGFPMILTTNEPAFSDMADSADALERLTTPADRTLVLADPIAMHTSFWIPALSGRDAYYGDWLWSWRDYPYGYEDRFRDWGLGLDSDWLRANAITVVMVARTSPDLLDIAERASYLIMLDPGGPNGYAIFRVMLPGLTNGWVNVDGGRVDGLRVSPENLSAQLHLPAAGVARVAINAFPGWQAVVNGRVVPITRTSDGFMEIPAPAGDSFLVLRYTTTSVVWLGRALTALGVLLLLMLALPPRRRHDRNPVAANGSWRPRLPKRWPGL